MFRVTMISVATFGMIVGTLLMVALGVRDLIVGIPIWGDTDIIVALAFAWACCAVVWTLQLFSKRDET